MKVAFVALAAIALAAPAQAQSSHALTAAVAASESGSATQSASPTRRHTFGAGGRVGGFTLGVGGSLRYWASDAFGVQMDFSHYGVVDVGVTQFAPSVLFVLGHPDLSKPMQIRPYAGGGMNIFHLSEGAGTAGLSDTGIGGQGFVGAEAVFAGAPNFGVSGDIGYYSTGTFLGVSVGGFAISLSGHYYFK
jgi:hypothetical protein